MAGRLRYWKEKDGRFWARIAVPTHLRPFLDRPRSELLEPLGGDRRVALRLHPAAVARMQREIASAEERAGAAKPASHKAPSTRTAITTADFGRAVWQRYTAALEADDATRAAYPTQAEIGAELAKLEDRVKTEGTANDPLAVLDASIDFLIRREARAVDQFGREARLAALKRELAAGETHQVHHEVEDYLARRNLSAEEGSSERAVLAAQLMRTEIQGIERTLERDRGDYTGQPTDQIVKPPAPEHAHDQVEISQLWADYLKSRVQAGFIKDGGKRQEPVIRDFLAFLKHDDARAVTKKELIAWRDHLLNEVSLSAKTVSDIYLSTIRSLFSWAHDNERLPENVAEPPSPRALQPRPESTASQHPTTVAAVQHPS